jgi:hypothetical protein
MYYHAVFNISGRTHWWANYGLEDFLNEIVLPFVEKHVVVVNYNNDKSLLNLGAASYLTLYRSNAAVTVGQSGQPIIRSTENCTQEIMETARLRRSVSENRSILQTQFASEKNQVFVVMKFNDKELDSA